MTRIRYTTHSDPLFGAGTMGEKKKGSIQMTQIRCTQARTGRDSLIKLCE